MFVECRINTNTRTYSHPGGRPRGEGLAPPLRSTHTNPAQGGNAFLAGKRARDKEGRLLSNEGPLYFPAAEVADLVRFMQLHEVLGVTDPYCQLPKTVR